MALPVDRVPPFVVIIHMKKWRFLTACPDILVRRGEARRLTRPCSTPQRLVTELYYADNTLVNFVRKHLDAKYRLVLLLE